MRLDRILFCEQVRQEKSGLLFLIGVFATDHLIMSDSDPNAPVVVRLSCFTVMDHMQGVTEFEHQVEVARSGEVIHRYPPSKARRTNAGDRLHSHVISFNDFTFPGAGEYAFNFIVKAHGDTIRFSRKFTVRPKTIETGPDKPLAH